MEEISGHLEQLRQLASRTPPALQLNPPQTTQTHCPECTVCLEQCDNIIGLSCGHADTCRNCLQKLIQIEFARGNILQAHCPTRGCTHLIDIIDIRNIFENNKTALDQYAEKSFKNWQEQAGQELRHCPTPNCTYCFSNDPDNKEILQCPLCHQTYCSNCLVNHPTGQPCTQTSAAKETDEWMKFNIAKCPRCQKPIEKIEECNHIHCTCGQDFCYDCQRESTGPDNHAFGCTGWNVGNARKLRTYPLWIEVLRLLQAKGIKEEQAQQEMLQITAVTTGSFSVQPEKISDVLATHTPENVAALIQERIETQQLTTEQKATLSSFSSMAPQPYYQTPETHQTPGYNQFTPNTPGFSSHYDTPGLSSMAPQPYPQTPGTQQTTDYNQFTPTTPPFASYTIASSSSTTTTSSSSTAQQPHPQTNTDTNGTDPLASFAQEIGITPDQLAALMGVSTEKARHALQGSNQSCTRH